MAFNRDWANAHRVNVYTHQTLQKLAKNGLIVYSWSLLKTVVGVSWDVVLDLAWPGDPIEWVSEQMRQYPIDNETTIRKELLYKPFVQDHTYKIKVQPWQTVSNWDVGKYIKIDVDQYLDPATLSTTEWQFRIEGIFQSGKYAEVRILNEKDMTSWTDLYIVSITQKVVSWNPVPWMYEATMSDGSKFDVDLTALVSSWWLPENQRLIPWPGANDISITAQDGTTILSTVDISTLISFTETITTLNDNENNGTTSPNHATYTKEDGTKDVIQFIKSVWLAIDNTDPNNLKLKSTVNGVDSNSLSLASIIAQIDTYINWWSYDPVSMILTLSDTNAGTPDITIDLSEFYIDVATPISYTDEANQLTATQQNQITQDTTTGRVVIRDKVGNAVVIKFNASQIEITNAGNFFTWTNIESVLQEIGQSIQDLFDWSVQSVSGNIVDNTDPLNPVVTQVKANWQETNPLLPWFIQNKLIRPDQLLWTTTNSKIVVRDTDWTFRDATASDITALWFTVSSWWPVEWLDWVAFSNWGNMQFRANYRWETLSWWAWIWWQWCWYDSITKTIIVSNFDSMQKYSLQWTQLSSIVSSWNWWIIKWHTAKRHVFTRFWSQKLNLDTFTIVWTVTWTLLDISPSWDVWISLTNNQFKTAWVWSFTITVFNCNTLAVINTYTYTSTAYIENNWFYWATLINDNEFVVYYANWFNWSRETIIAKVQISTASIIWLYNYWNSSQSPAWIWIQYSPLDNRIYTQRTTRSSQDLYSRFNIWLTTETVLWTSSTLVDQCIYRTGDLSIGIMIKTWASHKPIIIKQWVIKPRNDFASTGDQTTTQIAIVY